MERTTKIRITKTRKRTIRLSISTKPIFCGDCNREVRMLTSRDAADLVEMSQPQLEELVALGKAHAIQTLSGGLQICHDSLLENRSQKS